MNYKLIITAMVGGFIAALAVDISAWARSNGEKFDWGLAFKRWVAGAISGLSAGLTGNVLQ